MTKSKATFAVEWLDVEGSIANKIANPEERERRQARQSDFLDEWLSRRREERQDRDNEFGGELDKDQAS